VLSDLIAFCPWVEEQLLQIKFDWPVRLANVSDLIAFCPYVEEQLLQIKFDCPVRLANGYWNTGC
jgi:hypothetical protein